MKKVWSVRIRDLQLEKIVVQTISRRGPVRGVYNHHEFQKVKERLVKLVVMVLYKVRQGLHFQPRLVRFSFRLWPVYVHPVIFNYFSLAIAKENGAHLVIERAGSHPVWNRPTLLFNHGQMLNVLSCLIEQLTRVHFDKNANHGPDIAFLVPLAAV